MFVYLLLHCCFLAVLHCCYHAVLQLASRCYIVVLCCVTDGYLLLHCCYLAVLQMATCCYIVDNLLCYRRILCFESSRSGVTPQKSVQAIFKALVPACSLFEDGVVMSPLLSTGNQVIKSLCVYVMYMYVFYVISVLG